MMSTTSQMAFMDPRTRTRSLRRQRSLPTSAGRRASPQCKDVFKLEKLPTGQYISVPRQVRSDASNCVGVLHRCNLHLHLHTRAAAPTTISSSSAAQRKGPDVCHLYSVLLAVLSEFVGPVSFGGGRHVDSMSPLLSA
jgi:hypothetical protein